MLGGNQGQETKELMGLVITLLLSCSDRLRALENISFYSHMGKKDNVLITAAQDAHVCYLAQVEEEDPIVAEPQALPQVALSCH